MEDSIKTPRGTFPVRFDSVEEAEAAGYHLWFSEKDVKIVGNGINAAAVRPFGQSRVTEISPSAARKTVLFIHLADGWSISMRRNELRCCDIRVGDTLHYFRMGDAGPRVLLDLRPPDAVEFSA